MEPITFSAPLGLTERLRHGILAEGVDTLDRAFIRWHVDESMPVDGIALGYWIADQARSCGLAVGDPAQALVNVNAWLQRHRDKTAPYPCVNGLVALRADTTGGMLTIYPSDIGGPARTYTCADREVILFDGQEDHEVSPVVRTGPDGYRISILYYLPLEA